MSGKGIRLVAVRPLKQYKEIPLDYATFLVDVASESTTKVPALLGISVPARGRRPAVGLGERAGPGPGQRWPEIELNAETQTIKQASCLHPLHARDSPALSSASPWGETSCPAKKSPSAVKVDKAPVS
ncbi:hypothetical protein N658DRAFT_486933 [Parathielavia hyrcaniae]|uniref:Uncharacterized protein n=1 Tax=Parathielavia hyrcaniae TaxID=113614 RepID=A0AAN6Q2A3_9PEZI|nr:hypothetical protein N658DRAFT_486933 [Parathielavia hyrcaniae]